MENVHIRLPYQFPSHWKTKGNNYQQDQHVRELILLRSEGSNSVIVMLILVLNLLEDPTNQEKGREGVDLHLVPGL